MTGARQSLPLFLVVHGAGEVRAFLAVRFVFVLSRPNEDATVLKRWIGEQLHSVNGNLVDLRYDRGRKCRSFCKIRPHENPEITSKHAETCQCKELRELTAGHIALVRGMNRKFILPESFFTGFAEERHDSPPRCDPEHPVEWIWCPQGPSCALE